MLQKWYTYVLQPRKNSVLFIHSFDQRVSLAETKWGTSAVHGFVTKQRLGKKQKKMLHLHVLLLLTKARLKWQKSCHDILIIQSKGRYIARDFSQKQHQLYYVAEHP